MSYWQRGCDDAKAGKPPTLPQGCEPDSVARIGYFNGYYCGKRKYLESLIGQRTETPKPMQGTWTLTAPDGRTWQAESPLRVAALEQRERVPTSVALENIYLAIDEGERQIEGLRLVGFADRQQLAELSFSNGMSVWCDGPSMYHPEPGIDVESPSHLVPIYVFAGAGGSKNV